MILDTSFNTTAKREIKVLCRQPEHSAGTEKTNMSHQNIYNNVNICENLGWKSDFRCFFYCYSSFNTINANAVLC